VRGVTRKGFQKHAIIHANGYCFPIIQPRFGSDNRPSSKGTTACFYRGVVSVHLRLHKISTRRAFTNYRRFFLSFIVTRRGVCFATILFYVIVNDKAFLFETHLLANTYANTYAHDYSTIDGQLSISRIIAN